MCYTNVSEVNKPMIKDNSFTAKQVGERIRERRTELRLSMSQLGDRLSVNKSTIQRYETGGVDPERTILIVPIAEALETTPEWLTGKSDAKEYDSYTLCKKAIEQHISDYLDSMTSAVQGQPHQQLLTTFLGEIVDLYALFCEHFAAAMKAVDKIAEDEGLKESLRRYAIHPALIGILRPVGCLDHGKHFLSDFYKGIGFINIGIQLPQVDIFHYVPPFRLWVDE